MTPQTLLACLLAIGITVWLFLALPAVSAIGTLAVGAFWYWIGGLR